MRKRHKIAICLALSGVILANTKIERQIGQNNFNLVALADSPSLIKGSRGGYATNTIILDHEFIKNIKSVEVNNKTWNEDSDNNRPNKRGVYYLSTLENGDEFSIVFTKLEKNDKIVIKSDKKILSFTISEPTDQWNDNLIDKNSIKEENIGAEKEAPKENEEPDHGKTDEVAFTYKEDFGKNILGLADGRKVDKNKLEKIIINGKTLTEASSYLAISSGDKYAFSGDDLCINRLHDNDSLSITYDGIEYNYLYKDKKLVDNKNKKDVTYKIRLVGKFNNLLVGQTKIDGFSSSTASVSNNPNVVSVEYTDIEKPSKDDWKKLEDRGNEFNEVEAVVVDKDTGIKAKFAHGSINLGGSPTKAGTFKIKIIAEDKRGQKVESNEADVEVYNLGEKSLEELMVKDRFIQTQDKKYMWEMSPWKITKFNNSDNVVNVPKDLKAWFGSHDSGTYGELGFETIDEPTQTLVVGKGANLTFKNMKILGSVKIIVKDGGILNLDDSVVFGKIEVSNSGKLNVNYSPYKKEITSGASIWGQVILKDGAILGTSSIYSNTNYASQGKIVNTNDKPVIKVEGKAQIQGHVYIRGDEQATKGKSGQPALEIGPNGNLEIPENSSLNLFGGGAKPLTSVGGDGLKLDGGKVTGKGKLVAIGGSGYGKKGGSGISGHGSISVGTAYIRGGNSSNNPAKAVESDKIKFEGTKGIAIDGKKTTNNDPVIPEDYWNVTQKISDDIVARINKAIDDNKDKPIDGQKIENNKKEENPSKDDKNKENPPENKKNIKPDKNEEKNKTKNKTESNRGYLDDLYLRIASSQIDNSKNTSLEKYKKLKQAYEKLSRTEDAARLLMDKFPETIKPVRKDLEKLIEKSQKLRILAEKRLKAMEKDLGL